MLGMFGTSRSHPLSHPSELRRVLTGIAGLPPLAALHELTNWVESLVAGDGLTVTQQIALAHQLENGAHPKLRALEQSVFCRDDFSLQDEDGVCLAMHGFWSALALAYEVALDRFEQAEHGPEQQPAALARLAARLIRACRSRLLWDLMRCGPVDEGLWQVAGRAWLEAEGAGVLTRELSDGADGVTTTVAREYLATVAMHTAGLDTLENQHLDIAVRVILHFGAHFVLTDGIQATTTHWLDLAQPQPPLRLVRKPVPLATVRYFSATAASEAVESLRECADAGVVPAGFEVGREVPIALLSAVLGHLAANWSLQPPIRQHRRHPMSGPVTVVRGMRGIHNALIGDDPEATVPFRWDLEDISLGGVGAHAPNTAAEWLQVGSLIGLQPEGGQWVMGVVRRFQRGRDARSLVGVETLATHPAPVVVYDGETDTHTQAVALDPLAAGSEVRIVLAGRRFDPRQSLFLSVGSEEMRLDPVELVERGREYDIGRYRLEKIAAVGSAGW